MSDDEEEVTQEVADARETRELVLAAGLALAGRVIAHVEQHGVAYVVMEEELPAGPGVVWRLKAAYGDGHTFVGVEAEPKTPSNQTAMMHLQAFAQMMQNTNAQWSCNVPRAWIELAAAAAHAVPEFARERKC